LDATFELRPPWGVIQPADQLTPIHALTFGLLVSDHALVVSAAVDQLGVRKLREGACRRNDDGCRPDHAAGENPVPDSVLLSRCKRALVAVGRDLKISADADAVADERILRPKVVYSKRMMKYSQTKLEGAFDQLQGRSAPRSAVNPWAAQVSFISRNESGRQGIHPQMAAQASRNCRQPAGSRRSTVHLTACGRICLHRKKINISSVLAGQRLGIKEVDDGIWLVSFMHYDLGYFDLEQKTLQTLDNPFGTRLSPMS